MAQRNSNREDLNLFDDGATVTNSDGKSAKRSNSTYKRRNIGKIK